MWGGMKKGRGKKESREAGRKGGSEEVREGREKDGKLNRGRKRGVGGRERENTGRRDGVGKD